MFELFFAIYTGPPDLYSLSSSGESPGSLEIVCGFPKGFQGSEEFHRVPNIPMEPQRDFDGFPMEIEWLTNGIQWNRPSILSPPKDSSFNPQ